MKIKLKAVKTVLTGLELLSKSDQLDVDLAFDIIKNIRTLSSEYSIVDELQSKSIKSIKGLSEYEDSKRDLMNKYSDTSKNTPEALSKGLYYISDITAYQEELKSLNSKFSDTIISIDTAELKLNQLLDKIVTVDDIILLSKDRFPKQLNIPNTTWFDVLNKIELIID